MSRWTLVLLIGATVGFSAGSETARAGSLADALNSVFNPNPHATSGKAQKPAARTAEHSTERPAEHPRRVAHFRHPHEHEAKPPVAAPTLPDEEPPVTTAKTPSPAQPIFPGVAPTGEPNALKPHTVQTFSVLPPVPAVAPPETKEASPDIREPLAPPAASILVEDAVAKPATAPVPAPDSAPAPSPAILSGDGVLEFDLMLLFVACALVSINSRSSAGLSALMRPTRRGRLGLFLTNINRRSIIGALIPQPRAAAARSANRAASAPSSDAPALPPDVTWDCGGVGPSGSASAIAPSKPATDAKSANAGPELEDQLAMIVQDQIVVPLRKAS